VARLLRSIDGLLLMREAASAARMRSRLQALLDRGGVDPTREERQILRRQEADLLLLLDRPDEALATYAELLREDPTNGGVLLRSAELHRAAGRLEDAAIFCERAARVPPSQVDALVLHAQVETQRARYSRAVDLLAAAQALRPTDRVQRYLDQIRRLQALDEAAAAGVQ
jgi:tetratricopeptide (TPR) repeat protein